MDTATADPASGITLLSQNDLVLGKPKARHQACQPLCYSSLHDHGNDGALKTKEMQYKLHQDVEHTYCVHSKYNISTLMATLRVWTAS
eukprot:894113-Pelagomonas_calceolata.AAC.7